MSSEKEKRAFIARCVIYGLPKMNKRTVQRTAKWLRKLADDIEKQPKEYNSRFIARLF